MDIKLLIESAQGAKKTASGRWRAILAVPGQGSSGKYSAEMLEQYGPAAFPAGMKAYITHDEKRDPRDLLGFYPEGAKWDPAEDVAGALVSDLEVLPSHQAFAEEVAPHVGLSMFAMGRIDEDGNVTALVPDRMNGVDMVGYAGLEGSSIAEKLSERAKTLLETARTAASAVDRKEESMTPEEIKALAKAVLAEALAPVIADISERKLAAEAARTAEAAKDAKAPTVADAVEAYAAASKAISEAELFPRQEAALLAVAKEGKDITAALEDAKAVKDEATTSITESARPAGHRIDSGDDKNNYGTGLY